jgi:hypothetical protein
VVVVVLAGYFFLLAVVVRVVVLSVQILEVGRLGLLAKATEEVMV